MTVYCYADDCIYCEKGCCTRDEIWVSVDTECEDYKSYTDSAEYREGFWKAVKVDGIAAKAYARGKRFEYNGYVFFTQSKITEDEDFYLTDERTGVSVGRFAKLKEKWEKFVELSKDIPDVSSLPLACYDPYGHLVLADKKENEK